MARNGSGTYSLPAGNPVVTGTTISSTVQNNTMTDVANALTTSIATDGQSVITANIPFAGYKLTGIGAATVAGDALRWQQLFSQGAPVVIASAATVDIGAQTSVAVEITGTTPITSFGTNYNGPRFLRFTGALILTHNATTLNLPGGANITTVAGDTAIAYPNSGGNGWNVVNYLRSSGPTVPRSYLSGLTMSTAGSSATMSIAAGQAADSGNAVLMSLAASISKTTSAWAVGTAAGGLDTGSIANNTWYHFYLIRRPDTDVQDVVFSTSASAPALPTNYTQYRRIGSGKTNGSAQWLAFTQVGDFFEWATPSIDINVVNLSTTTTLYALGGSPTGVQCTARISLSMVNGALTNAYVNSPYANDESASGGRVSMVMQIAGQTFTSQFEILTDTSAQIQAVATSASTTLIGATIGYTDTRGK